MSTQYAARTMTFGDWGSPCLAVWGTPDWPAHIATCTRCAAVQARFDAERHDMAAGAIRA